jgi:hypothetical protein
MVTQVIGKRKSSFRYFALAISILFAKTKLTYLNIFQRQRAVNNNFNNKTGERERERK